MKFSVLIPVYNAEKYLEEAINSVICQGYDDFEIVVVDDGSTDESYKIYSKYTNEYPDNIIAVKQENSGQLAARCKAISQCSGDYCLFLDADDLLAENTFLVLAEQIKKYNFPDIVAFPFYYDRNGELEKSSLICENERLYEDDDLKRLNAFFFENTLLNSACTKAVRKDIAVASTEGYEKYTKLRCAEDRYQSMMMLKCACRMLYIPTPLYRYRLFDGSTTRQFTVDNIRKFNTVILYDFEKELLSEWDLNTKEHKTKFEATWADYTLYVFNMFFYRVDKKERQRVLEYPWESFLPKEISYRRIYDNAVLSDIKKQMWHWIEEKNYKMLNKYFYKKDFIKKLRKIKGRFF